MRLCRKHAANDVECDPFSTSRHSGMSEPLIAHRCQLRLDFSDAIVSANQASIDRDDTWDWCEAVDSSRVLTSPRSISEKNLPSRPAIRLTFHIWDLYQCLGVNSPISLCGQAHASVYRCGPHDVDSRNLVGPLPSTRGRI
jgi:hypothetical protein